MSQDKLDNLRQLISEMLVGRGLPPEFTAQDSLFDSGRLDSVCAVNILMELESAFGIDLADPDFDVSQIDTLEDISQLVSATAN